MYTHRLHQTLIIRPEIEFLQIENALERIGWKKALPTFSMSHCIAGEPEAMTWEWAGGKPFISYSFNPVAKLRVLDVASLPPQKRGEIAALIPLVNDEQLQHYFTSDNVRERLLALWTCHETQRLDWLSNVANLHNDSDATVSAESLRITEKLKDLAEHRTQVLATLRLVASAAEKIIHDIHQQREFIHVLMPTEDDCKALFDEHLAPAVFREIKKTYQTLGNLDIEKDFYHVEVMAAHAGLLRWSNELSDRFPRGYRDITGWMKPHKIWLSWAWIKPLEKEEKKEKTNNKNDGDKKMPEGTFSQSKQRISYDGLAWVDDHWVWLPKIYHILSPLIQDYIDDAQSSAVSAEALH
jgi:hypothetical protein